MATQHIYETLPDEQPTMKLSLWLIPACMFGAAVWAGVGYLVWRAVQ